MKLFSFSAKSPRALISDEPLFYLAIAFACGIWLSYFFRPSFGYAAYVAVCLLLASASAVGKRYFIFLSAALFLALGVLFESNARMLPKNSLARVAPEGFLTLEGKVLTVPEMTRRGRKETISLVLEADSFRQRGERHNVRGRVQVFLYNPKHSIRFGDRLKLRGKLQVPISRRNPHALDYKNYLAQQGIFNVFHGFGASSVFTLPGRGSNLFLIGLNRLRVFLKDRLSQLLPFPENALGSALILGFRKDIPRTILDDFSRSGTAHLLSISGLHIALIGQLIYFLGRLVRIPRGWNLALTACLISLYTVLAGSGAPVLRSAIMGSMILIGLLTGGGRHLKSAFFFSFFALLVFDPHFLFQPSFQLSFLAMGSLIFLRPRLEEVLDLPRHRFPISYLTRVGLESTSVLIGMLPVLIWYFHLFSPVSFLANMVAIPLSMIGIAAEFLALFADLIFPALGKLFSYLPRFCFTFTVWFAGVCSRIPFGHFYVPAPGAFFICLYYGLLLAWIFLGSRFYFSWFRKTMPVMLGMVYVFGSSVSLPSPFRILFFDLGKTEASFVSFSSGRNCLINAGRRYPNDQAYWVLRPFLMGSGLRTLDCVFLTGLDSTHAGGVPTLKRHFRISSFLAPPKSFEREWAFSFGPDSRIEMLVVSRGRPLAFRIREGRASALYLVSTRTQVFESLLQEPNVRNDFIFLPHHEYGISEAEEIFLKRARPAFIVLNQREKISELKMRLESMVSARLLFIQDLGAVELRFRNGNWNWKNFKT